MLPGLVKHPAVAAAAAGAAMGLVTLAMWRLLRRRPTAEELEQRRRLHLAATGRIVDGELTDAKPDDSAPRVLLYRYRVAGVTYECAQDVSALSGRIANVRLELPVQVRYDRLNPGDSIVMAETWDGLWGREAATGQGSYAS